MADRSPQKFAKVVTGSFAVLSLLYLLCMGFGYATFGDKAAANVLNNYAEADTLAVRAAAAAHDRSDGIACPDEIFSHESDSASAQVSRW